MPAPVHFIAHPLILSYIVPAFQLFSQPLIHFWLARMFTWAAAPLGMLAVMASAFGAEGMTLCVGQAALSVLMLEAANYIQHYGLQRTKLDNGRSVYILLLLAQTHLNLPPSSAKWQAEEPGPRWAPA